VAIRDGRLAQLRHHAVPAWWLDAKLGVFVHWTMAAVPAFAPAGDDMGGLIGSGRRDAFAWSPYTEWYENSIRFADSPAARHHRDTYGAQPYAAFRPAFESAIGDWDPGTWAAAYAATGARYVVLVAKHHDGYCLWPTDVDNPRRPGWHSSRDVVGELADAVRAAGMRFGLYYSGGLDWTFDDRPIGTMGDMLAAVPRGAYPDYAEAQVRELIDRYRPSVLWNDIAWPAPAARLWSLFEHYYATVPDGVVNDRWMPWNPLLGAARSPAVRRALDAVLARTTSPDGGIVPPKPPHFDVRTPEYVAFDDVQRTPWECVRGMDHSFGYNACSRPEDFIGRADLLWLLADIAAKGGNLLLNVGPRGTDAAIPTEQADRLGWLGEWTGTARRGLFDTRPWVRPGDATADGAPVRFTARGGRVFAHVRAGGGPLVLGDVRPTRTTTASTLDGRPLVWTDTPGGLRVDLPAPRHPDEPATVALDGVEARAD
jgi:alpha-L-fucosidase